MYKFDFILSKIVKSPFSESFWSTVLELFLSVFLVYTSGCSSSKTILDTSEYRAHLSELYKKQTQSAGRLYDALADSTTSTNQLKIFLASTREVCRETKISLNTIRPRDPEKNADLQNVSTEYFRFFLNFTTKKAIPAAQKRIRTGKFRDFRTQNTEAFQKGSALSAAFRKAAEKTQP
jgi:hypothetical protein